MREDMFKVIVERPRNRWVKRNGSHYPRGELKNEFGGELEDAPRTQGYGHRYHEKNLNENLAPLKRYLNRQVGRPWDKVYSELAEHLRLDNAVQRHVFEHVGDFVYIRTRLDAEGRVWGQGRRYGPPTQLTSGPGARKLESYPRREALYVHPRTGLLCKVEAEPRRRDVQQDPDLRVIDDNTQLHRIEGIWYRIDLAKLLEPLRRMPPNYRPNFRCYDVLLRRYVDEDGNRFGILDRTYGRRDRYAVAKKQLSKREKLRYLG